MNTKNKAIAGILVAVLIASVAVAVSAQNEGGVSPRAILPGAITSEHIADGTIVAQDLSNPLSEGLCNNITGSLTIAAGGENHEWILQPEGKNSTWGFFAAESNITGSILVGTSTDGTNMIPVITNEGLSTKYVADDCGGYGIYIMNKNTTHTMLVNYTYVYHITL